MIGYIYCYTSKTSGKKYVGQTTKTLQERAGKNGYGYRHQFKFSKAIKKYGWSDFSSEILETVYANSEQELIKKLNELEIFWISKFDSFSSGYNADLGGCHHILTEVSKEKLRQSHLGKDPWNKGKTGYQKAWNLGTSSLPNICMYDLKTGKLLKKFSNGNEAAKHIIALNIKNVSKLIGTVSSRIFIVCKANHGKAYGYIWRFDDGVNILSEEEIKHENISPRAKTVLQLDLDGNILAEYESAASYSKTQSNIYNEQRKIAHTISDACNGKIAQFNNFKWKFKE